MTHGLFSNSACIGLLHREGADRDFPTQPIRSGSYGGRIFFSIMVTIFTGSALGEDGDSVSVNLLGRWAYGACFDVVIDGGLVYIRDGGLLEILDGSDPDHIAPVSPVFSIRPMIWSHLLSEAT